MKNVLKTEILYFVVLVPHSDVEGPWNEYRRGLFRAGITGAYALPAVAPLALAARPLAGEALSALARELRRRLAEKTGKFSGLALDTLELPAPPLAVPPGPNRSLARPGTLLGLGLSPDIQDIFPVKEIMPGEITRPFGKAILAAAVLDAPPAGPPDAGIPPPPEVSFRAAALANMALHQSGPLFEWELGKPAWLPREPKTHRATRAL